MLEPVSLFDLDAIQHALNKTFQNALTFRHGSYFVHAFVKENTLYVHDLNAIHEFLKQNTGYTLSLSIPNKELQWDFQSMIVITKVRNG